MVSLTAAEQFARREDLVVMMLETYFAHNRIEGDDLDERRAAVGRVAVVFPDVCAKLLFHTITPRLFAKIIESPRRDYYLGIAKNITDSSKPDAIGTVSIRSAPSFFVKSIRRSCLGVPSFPRADHLDKFLKLCHRLNRLTFGHKAAHHRQKLAQHWVVERSSRLGRQWKLTVYTVMNIVTERDIDRPVWTIDPAYQELFEVDVRVTLRLDCCDERVREGLRDPKMIPAGLRAIDGLFALLPLPDLVNIASMPNGGLLTNISVRTPRYTLEDLRRLGELCPNLQLLHLRGLSFAAGQQSLVVRYFSDLAPVIRDAFDNLRDLELSIARSESKSLDPIPSYHLTNLEPAKVHNKLERFAVGGTVEIGDGVFRQDILAYALELACLGGFDCEYTVSGVVDSDIRDVLAYLKGLSPARQRSIFDGDVSSAAIMSEVKKYNSEGQSQEDAKRAVSR